MRWLGRDLTGTAGSAASRARNGSLHTDARESLPAALRSLLVRAELGLLMAAVPLLLFPRWYLPWVGLGLLVIGWLLRGIGTNVWLVRTPLNRPIAVLLLMTMVSLYPSVDLGLSMPKFYGILVGFAIYYAACGAVSSQRHFWLGVGLVIAALVAVIVLGLLGSDWSQYKFPVLRPVYSLIPQVIRDVQTSFGPRTGFHPNELGGALAFLVPLPLALALSARIARPLVVVLLAAVLTSLGVLVLTASRSAITAAGIMVVLLVVWRWRRLGLALVAVGAVAVGVTLILSAPTVLDFLLKADAASVAPGEGSLPGRLEIWERAGYMIEDFPFTGIGLNAFPIVLETLYPPFLTGPFERIPHAHNIFLQTAIDLGVGGLLGFLGLWACVAYAGWLAYRRVRDVSVRGPFQAAIVGLLAGLLSYLVFGLTDAITLGAKPTVLLWLMMGLIVAAERLAGQSERSVDQGEARISQQPSRGDPCADVGLPASTPVSQLQGPAVLDAAREAPSFSPGAEQLLHHRVIAFLLAAACNVYWAIAFFLVGMGYLVIVLGILE